MTGNVHPDEQTLRDELYALIRYLYSQRLAGKIIQAFEDAFAARDAHDRLAICAQWIDFYRARRYHKAMRRRRPTRRERLTPCSACGYPVSHRHHLWDIATHGENAVTVQLCANCHELHHLLYNTLARNSEHSRRLALRVLESPQVSPAAIQRIVDWCLAILKYEVANGWLEPYKVSDAWIEDRLRWSAFQRRAAEV